MISVIIPVYNEKGNIKKFYEVITKIITGLKKPYELIFVDDGSTDNSLDMLKAIHQNDNNVKIITLSRNFGHQPAITAGMDYASGDAVITIDADFQHPPELIPKLVEKWKEGYDIVYTVRKQYEDAGLLKKLTSAMFYKILNAFSEVKVPNNAADYRLLDRKVVNSLKNFKERARFIRGLVSWVGYRQIPVHYNATTRYKGESKFSLNKMVKLAVDGITSFSSVPLYISTFIGFAVSMLSFIYLIYALYIKLFTNQAIEGWTSILVAILFLGGIQLIALGVIGSYLGRVYIEVKERPFYIVNKTAGFDNK